MNEKLSFRERIGYGLTGFGNGCWMALLSSFLLFFYTDVAGIRPAVASGIISAATIWDAINDPLIASFADNHRFRSGERIRPYLLIASVPMALCLALLFTVFGSGTLTAVMAFVTYFLFRIPSTFYCLPMGAMAQLATPSDEERVTLNTYSSGGGAFGTAFCSVALLPIIRAVAGLDESRNMVNPRRGFFVGALLVGIVVVASAAYNYFTTRERVRPETENKEKFLPSCAVILRCRSFRQNLLLTFFYGTICSLVTGYALYYCTHVLGNQALATPVTAMYIVGVAAALPFVRRIYEKLGRTKLLLLAAAILTAGSVVFLAAPRLLIAPFFYCLCIGVGSELVFVLLAINRADVTDILEKESGVRHDGMVGNVSNFIQKCATAVLTALLGVVLELVHYDADLPEQPASALTAIVLIMGLGGLISALLIGVVSSRLNLDSELEKYGIRRKE